MRDLALNLFWANRFSMTMYEKRPTRWADVPRTRSDVFLPVLEPWEDGEAKVAGVQEAYRTLPAGGDDAEDRIFAMLFDVFGNRKHHATTLPAVKPTVAEFLAQPGSLTFRLPDYDPDFPVYDYTDIVDCSEDVPELEALHRWAMVLHNQYPWDRSQVELVRGRGARRRRRGRRLPPAGQGGPGLPARLGAAPASTRRRAPESRPPVRPFPAVDVRRHFSVLPRLEALAAVHGDQVCSNDDLIRNTAYNWSPMSADEIRDKTGIEQRRYSRADPGGARSAGRRGGARESRSGAGGDRRRPGLHLHQLAAHPVRGDLSVRPARHLPDARRLRHHRRLRGHALRAGRGHPPPAGGPAAGARGVRGEVLRQDRQRPDVAHDLRGRCGSDRHRRRSGG